MNPARAVEYLFTFLALQPVITGICAIQENGGLDRSLQRASGGFVEDFELFFDRCEGIDLDNIEADLNILCYYSLSPSGSSYTSELIDVNSFDECIPDSPSPYVTISEGFESGVVEDTEFQVGISVNGRGSFEFKKGQDELVFQFCVRNTLIHNDMTMRYRHTRVKVTFTFVTEFEVKVALKYEFIAQKPFVFQTPFGVDSYQCTVDYFPRTDGLSGPDLPVRSDAVIKIGDSLALCVETGAKDTFVKGVKDVVLEITIPGRPPIIKELQTGGKTGSGRGSISCEFNKSGSEVIGSFCHIVTTPPWAKFSGLNFLLGVTGEVDLRIIEERNRALYDLENIKKANVEESVDLPFSVKFKVDPSGTQLMLTKNAIVFFFSLSGVVVFLIA